MKLLAAGALTALAAACAGPGRGPDFPTSSSFPELRRRPPTFAAQSSEAGSNPSPGRLEAPPALQTLATPLDSEAARAVVSRFFMAVLLESTTELYPLFAAQAWVVSEGSRQPAQALWRTRLAQLDYTSLAGRAIATPQTLRTYTFETSARARQDGVPSPAAPGEVVVVVTPALSWSGKTRLFGDQLAFRLRPQEAEPAYEIAEIAEDFRLP